MDRPFPSPTQVSLGPALQNHVELDEPMERDEEQWLVLSPRGLVYAIGLNGNVVIRLDYDGTLLGLAPGIVLAMEMTPDEARLVGRTLVRKADEADNEHK